jgi:hypothetical protein
MLAGLDNQGVSYLLFQDVWGDNEMDERQGTWAVLRSQEVVVPRVGIQMFKVNIQRKLI